jgi:quinol monooxygenase YgiN
MLVGPRRSLTSNLAPIDTSASENIDVYGLIAKMTAVAGQRDTLASILVDSTQSMPGCLSYVIATDPTDADAIWITEVWDSAASHKTSLTLPAVQHAIAQARPLIAGFSNRVETVPIGGHGLPRPSSP